MPAARPSGRPATAGWAGRSRRAARSEDEAARPRRTAASRRSRGAGLAGAAQVGQADRLQAGDLVGQPGLPAWRGAAAPGCRNATTPTPTSTASTTVALIRTAAVARDLSLPRRPGLRIPAIGMTITCFWPVRPADIGKSLKSRNMSSPSGPGCLRGVPDHGAGSHGTSGTDARPPPDPPAAARRAGRPAVSAGPGPRAGPAEPAVLGRALACAVVEALDAGADAAARGAARAAVTYLLGLLAAERPAARWRSGSRRSRRSRRSPGPGTPGAPRRTWWRPTR